MDLDSIVPAQNSHQPDPAVDRASPQDVLTEHESAADTFVSDTALMVTQGKHRFYSMVLPSDVLAATCTADTRHENPIARYRRLHRQRFWLGAMRHNSLRAAARAIAI
jgi:hypothetical protein